VTCVFDGLKADLLRACVVLRIGEIEHLVDLLLGRAVEHRCCERHAGSQVLAQLDNFLVLERSEVFRPPAARVVDFVEEAAHGHRVLLRFQQFADALAEAFRSPAQMRLEDLTHVHPRRHAKRIQHDVDRRAIRHVRHVFHRSDLRDHTLVAVTASHLVARLETALHRQVHLHHLLHARRKLVALRQLLALLFVGTVEHDLRLLERLLQLLHLLRDVVGRDTDVEPRMPLDVGQVLLGDLRALRELLRTAVCSLVQEQPLETRERVVLDDAKLVGEVFLVALQLVVDDLLRALVALDAFAREDLHVDHRARTCPKARAATCP
jgi:hypothetical protein